MNGGLIILYFARLLDGFTGGNTAIAQAYVSDITSEKERTQALGYLSAAMGVGFILGPAIGGLLAATIGISAPFIFGTFMAAVGLLLTFFFLDESLPLEKRGLALSPQKPAQTLTPAVQNPMLVHLFVIGILTTLCFAAISPTFSLYAREILFTNEVETAVVSRNVGFIFMLVGVVIAITQGGLLKPIVKHLGEIKALWLSQLLLILTFISMPHTSSPWLVAGLLIPLAFAYSIAEPTLQSMISKNGPEEQMGQRLGRYHSFLSLAFMLGPIWAGFVFQQINPQALWTIGGLLLIPSFALAQRLLKAKQLQPVPSPSGRSPL